MILHVDSGQSVMWYPAGEVNNAAMSLSGTHVHWMVEYVVVD